MNNRIILDAPNYLISSCGVVANSKTGRVLKLDMSRGYKRVRLGKYGRKMSVHRLVAIAFIPNPQNKPQVNHKDGDKSNNKLDNLEWCTQSENLLHAVKIGLKPKTTQKHQDSLKKAHTGRKPSFKQMEEFKKTTNKNRKISLEDASELCEAFCSGIGVIKIAKYFNVTRGAIYAILNNTGIDRREYVIQ